MVFLLSRADFRVPCRTRAAVENFQHQLITGQASPAKILMILSILVLNPAECLSIHPTLPSRHNVVNIEEPGPAADRKSPPGGSPIMPFYEVLSLGRLVLNFHLLCFHQFRHNPPIPSVHTFPPTKMESFPNKKPIGGAGTLKCTPRYGFEGQFGGQNLTFR